MDAVDLRWTILRLPRVYGMEENYDLGTIYGFSKKPNWRWTHGHVRNVAGAIVHAAAQPNAEQRVFNVGEAVTPTMAERLACLPADAKERGPLPPFDFRQDLVLDTTRLRDELGFLDLVSEVEAKTQLLKAMAN